MSGGGLLPQRPPGVYVQPVLYKYMGRGRPPLTWQCLVRPRPQEGGGCYGEIVTRYGHLGGAVQETSEVIAEGKNLGRANATTPWEQAVAEATSRHTAQLARNHYGTTEQESFVKRRLAPMLAAKWADYAAKVDWAAGAYGQPKLDGHRCVARCEAAGVVRLYTRKGDQITTLPHIVEALQQVMGPRQVLDGELYRHGMNLQEIGSLVRRAQAGTASVQYHCYDMFMEERFARRHRTLHGMLRGAPADGPLQLVQTLLMRGEPQLMEYQAQCIAAGYEGAMLRHGSEAYQPGKRHRQLLKVKTFHDAEFEILGAEEGRGMFAGMAIFTCSTGRGGTFEVTAPGTHEEKQRAWRQRHRYIGRQLTVKYAGWTATAEPKPFHPVALRMREDI